MTNRRAFVWVSVLALALPLGQIRVERNFQAPSANLTAIAALTPTDGNIIVGDGTTWVVESGATARTSLGLGTGDSPQFTAVTATSTLTTPRVERSANGTGVRLESASLGFVVSGIASSAVWEINSSGALVTGAGVTTNTRDIGRSDGANTPRTGYFGTSVVAPTLNATTAYQANGTPGVTAAGCSAFTFGLCTTAADPIDLQALVAEVADLRRQLTALQTAK